MAHSRFQGLGAFYRAPEAEDLFASTAPVRDRADLFASKVETVAQALDEYAVAVRPVIKRLDRLRGQVADFVSGLKTDDGEIDAEWTQDQDKIDQHAALWVEIAEAQAAFSKAEITANNKITALVDGTQYVAQGYEGTLVPLGARVYGYTAEALKHADKLPWGTPEARTYDKWDFSHHVEEAGVSVKDNLVGAVTGFVDLVSPGADGAAARKGLYMSALGLESYLFDPLNRQDSPWKEQAAEGRPYAKAFAKSMVGWDDWEEHPGKATGTVIFNSLTFASGPLAAVARIAKGGAVAKTAGTLAKVGEALDPLSATAKTVGATTRAIPKIADVTARARAGFADIPGAGSTSSVWRISATTELHLTDGKFAIIKDGAPDTTPAPIERPAHERVPSVGTSREHQLAGVGARAPEATADASENLPPRADRDTPARGGGSNAGGERAGGTGGGSYEPWSATDAHHDQAGKSTGPQSGEHRQIFDRDANGTGSGVPYDSSAGLPPAQRTNEPLPELTPQERAQHWSHLEEVEMRSPGDFDHLQRDPDKNGGISEPSKDEARVGLDLRDQKRLPDDLQRPTEADRGEFYSPSTGRYYDIKGVHSDWPPFNNVRDKSRPFKGAYDPANNGRWVKKLAEQIVEKQRIVILDVRNANQAAIDDLKSIVQKNGWEDDVIWYP
ncbi:hypothetical protein [Streptomyces alboniger]|nr:hypothetical protein [Streptomyces alboniger]